MFEMVYKGVKDGAVRDLQKPSQLNCGFGI